MVNVRLCKTVQSLQGKDFLCILEEIKAPNICDGEACYKRISQRFERNIWEFSLTKKKKNCNSGHFDLGYLSHPVCNQPGKHVHIRQIPSPPPENHDTQQNNSDNAFI